MWVGVLIGVVAGLVAIAGLALILGVPLADAMRGGAGVIGALILAAATLFILPAALIGMVLFLVFEFLRDLGGVGSAAAGGDIGGDLPDVQDLLDRQRRMARLSAWWRSSSRSSWPSWWCERS